MKNEKEYVQEVELEGHIIDSLILPKVLDTIMDLGGDFEILDIKVGKRKTDTSYARILVKAKSKELLQQILHELHRLGANIPQAISVELKPAPRDCVLPDDFYSTTNHKTFIYLNGELIEVEDIKMDGVIVVDPKKKRAWCKTIREVKKGDLIVVGNRGVLVKPEERPRHYTIFNFMESTVSSERPNYNIIRYVAEEILNTKKEGKKIVVVAGPAVVHTGASEDLATMIREGFVDVLFAGNALAVHDIEYQLFGTSLGMDIKTGRTTKYGHRNHLRAINEVMKAGSIKKLVESGKLKGGIMYECIRKNIPYVLAGSIRDDGPLPEVITDVVEAQKEMRKHLKNCGLVLILATMLHGIATGNLLPSHVKTVCVDINPAVITKLIDRGTAHAVGIVSDVGLFLKALVKELLAISKHVT